MIVATRLPATLTPRQSEQVEAWQHVLRWLYNATLEVMEHCRTYGRRVPSRYDLQRDLTDLRAEYEWTREVLTVVARQAVRQAHDAWWNGMRRDRRQGRARFRGKNGRPLSIICDARVKVERLSRRQGRVHVQKLGWVKIRLHRDPLGDPKRVTLKQDATGQWWASILYEDHQEPPTQHEHPGTAVGIDRGVTTSAATSDGQTFQVAGLTPGEAKRLHVLQRSFARQIKGSNRRERTKVSIAKLRGREASRRRDFAHQVSHTLTRDHELVAIEALDVVAMSRSAKGTVESPGTNVSQKRGLNRAIRAQGWGMLRTCLKYKSEWRGGLLTEVDPAYTSQTCSQCSHRASESRESQASFRCTACGYQANADINASRVILTRALNRTAVGRTVAARGGVEALTLTNREPHQTERAA